MFKLSFHIPIRRSLPHALRSIAAHLEKFDQHENDGGPIYMGRKIVGEWSWTVKEEDPNRAILKRRPDGKFVLTPSFRRFTPKLT